MDPDIQSFSEIVNLWPAAKVLAEDIGEKPETVRKWRSRNRIPSVKWQAVINAAKKRRYPVTSNLLIQLDAA